jgi:hypothetical protein
MLTSIFKAFGNNMFDVPLLITRPEVKEVAESVTKRTGQEVTPAHVMYEHPCPFFAIAEPKLILFQVLPGLRSVATVSSPSRSRPRASVTTSRRWNSPPKKLKRSALSARTGDATTLLMSPTSLAGTSISSVSLKRRLLTIRLFSAFRFVDFDRPSNDTKMNE